MKLLNRDELQFAEAALLTHLPKSYQVYGLLHCINRNKPNTLQVVVDTWPDFKVILCRPDPKNKNVLRFMKKVSCFCLDQEALKKVLTEENSVDWSTLFMFAALDTSYVPLIKEVSSIRELNSRYFTLVHLLFLPDVSGLVTPEVDRRLESRVSSLNHTHVDLVNKTWKFGGNQLGYNTIENLIINFPSCCILDEQDQPVSWILMYDYCAMGILYTLPEYRGRGYAKVVITTMAKKLASEGYPAYCFIEEDNKLSYKLFKNLGFIDDPSYRAAWLEIDPTHKD
ncbi:glycine N-acyltransferase-like protein 3 [Gouania willdenowi]|uniref:Glycine N-acyltransferase-like protein n=1 Tax=Gouania willdenowi TaxID=441366 RepID=A0A8C5NGS5_GOUWI|nr:glycine N-acyltransferase-like protein 3 [Gouania willdenowi]